MHLLSRSSLRVIDRPRGPAVLVGLLCVLVSGLPAGEETPNPKVQGGRIERLADFPSRFVEPRHVDVWLPDGYTPDQRHPVVYMHDGQMLFDGTRTFNQQEWGVDEVASRLIADRRTAPFLVVGIWNSGAGRYADYFPARVLARVPADYLETQAGPLAASGHVLPRDGQSGSDGYLRFLVEELKPYIDAHYATRPGRDDTFVLGSSMGGLISLYAICEYPEVFGGAACLSTHWTGTFSAGDNPIPGLFADYLREHHPDPATHRIYFDHGTETLDALYGEGQERIDAVMRASGFGPENWVTRVYPGAAHDENSWRARLDVPLLFLLAPPRERRLGSERRRAAAESRPVRVPMPRASPWPAPPCSPAVK